MTFIFITRCPLICFVPVIKTSMTRSLFEDHGREEAFQQMTPLRLSNNGPKMSPKQRSWRAMQPPGSQEWLYPSTEEVVFVPNQHSVDCS